MDKVLEIGHFSAGFAVVICSKWGGRCRLNKIPLPSWVTSEAMDLYLHSDKKWLTARIVIESGSWRVKQTC